MAFHRGKGISLKKFIQVLKSKKEDSEPHIPYKATKENTKSLQKRDDSAKELPIKDSISTRKFNSTSM